MAKREMVRDLFKDQENYGYYQEFSAVGVGDWIVVPKGCFKVLLTLTPNSSTGSIEYTNSPISMLDNGSPDIITWDDGVVNASTSASMDPVTAFRVNVASGTDVKVSAKAALF